MNDLSWWQATLQEYRGIAVIRCSSVEQGLAMAQAVAQGGMRLIEVTWNSSQPATIIGQLREALPHCIIGTGTVLTVEQLREAIACGAQFSFTPHVNLGLIQVALSAQLPFVPGALSPTEITTAWQAGATAVKVFPVGAMGGVNYIKSLQGPLSSIPMIPTGGITLSNAREFIAAGALAVGLSGDLFPEKLIHKQDWAAIRCRAQKLQDSFEDFT